MKTATKTLALVALLILAGCVERPAQGRDFPDRDGADRPRPAPVWPPEKECRVVGGCDGIGTGPVTKVPAP